jgi:hypothetical protein
MKEHKLRMAGIALLAMATVPVLWSAQNGTPERHGEQPRYRLIDLGTFGGPTSGASLTLSEPER